MATYMEQRHLDAAASVFELCRRQFGQIYSFSESWDWGESNGIIFIFTLLIDFEEIKFKVLLFCW